MLLDLNKPCELVNGELLKGEVSTLGQLLGTIISNCPELPETLKKDYIKLYLIGKELVQKGCVEVDESDLSKIDQFLDHINIKLGIKAEISLALIQAKNEHKEMNQKIKETTS